MVSRRRFLQRIAGGAIILAPGRHRPAGRAAAPPVAPHIGLPLPGEDVFGFIRRRLHRHDEALYAQILGAANEFKEGDQAVGLAAADDDSRDVARTLLSNTRIADIDQHAIHQDNLYRYITQARDERIHSDNANQTLGQLKKFLLNSDEATVKSVLPDLSSDAIACVVKLMSNSELVQIGKNIFHALPGSQIGARGYLGARIQPNSPTDHVDDIRWQVLDGWSYAVGDVLLGTNPVSSDPNAVAAVEQTLQDLLTTFGINHVMPHCVLSHIDVQSEVESLWPGSTELWFQSIAGCDAANETFDISVEKMKEYAATRSGQFGLYFETGQGADFTNGHSHGFDMVIHEARKYGFARALTQQVAAARRAAGSPGTPWVHLNDVAGFIGPEVFRTREQLVRCCLEDIVMGKLHGLCIGLDVCSTLHMDVSLDDLDWCLDQIMPANPAYLMALPTKIDPMLGYLTTGYQDHVRLRERFHYRVNDRMWAFFQDLQVIDEHGRPTEHFGDPLWVFLQYRRRKGDVRTNQEILEEGRLQLAQVRGRGVFISEGHGEQIWDLKPELGDEIHRVYDDAKLSIWAELSSAFIETIPDSVPIATLSTDRMDYILHPTSGEQPSEVSTARLQQLRQRHAGQFDVQIVISDGLNALAIMEDAHLTPFLQDVRRLLEAQGRAVSPQNLVVTSGRVRAGYRIGETLFGGFHGPHTILHIIGERPGTGHRTFSAYITATTGQVWGDAGTVDHNITKVVSGIAVTALRPQLAAQEVARLLQTMLRSEG